MPLWRLGFRPFYLGASLYAALSIVVWTLQYVGALRAYALPGPLGHAHEMLFGFAFAVIAGFLFTAARNWTQQPTPSGASLAAIFAVWGAGRALAFMPVPSYVAALVNAAFPAVVAAALAQTLLAARNRRNYFFVAVLAAAAIAALLVNLAAMDVIATPPWLGVQIALDLVLLLLVVMGGRVIPMFTNNGVPGADARRVPGLEKAAVGAVLAVLAADVAGLSGTVLAALLTVAAVAHGARLALWHPWRTTAHPIVWILHAGYAWIALHLALRAAAELALVPPPAATHALTVGAIGGLTIAMMTRTARGHTGLPLVADRADVAAYGLVLAASVIRVLGPLAAPAMHVAWIVISAAAWSAAYGTYFVAYLPRLTAPRADGRPG
jgi:uncharacterized protein involved in response to NO